MTIKDNHSEKRVNDILSNIKLRNSIQEKNLDLILSSLDFSIENTLMIMNFNDNDNDNNKKIIIERVKDFLSD